MKKYTFYSLFLLLACAFLFPSNSSAQFVTLARKIKSKHTPQLDVAAVTIDAKTSCVYQAVIDTVTSSKMLTINNRDNAKRLIEFTSGTCKVSLKVDSLGVALSQITATSTHSETATKQGTEVAVDEIKAVCYKLGIKCTVDKK
jgi:hypothetical protein